MKNDLNEWKPGLTDSGKDVIIKKKKTEWGNWGLHTEMWIFSHPSPLAPRTMVDGLMGSWKKPEKNPSAEELE